MKTIRKKKTKRKKIKLLLLIVAIFLLFFFAGIFKLTGFNVIIATVVEEETQPTLTGTVLTPTTAETPKDSNPPIVTLTAPVKYLELNELVPLECQAIDDTAVDYTAMKVTSPNGSVSIFRSKLSTNNLTFRVTDVGNYSFICMAEDTSNNIANSVRYLLPVVTRTIPVVEKSSSPVEISVPEKNVITNETVNTTAVNVTVEPIIVQWIRRFLEFFVRSK